MHDRYRIHFMVRDRKAYGKDWVLQNDEIQITVLCGAVKNRRNRLYLGIETPGEISKPMEIMMNREAA